MTGAASAKPTAAASARALACALAAVALAYALTPFGGFVWDDHSLIAEDPAVLTLRPIWYYFSHLFWSGPLSVEQRYYRPLVTLSYALERRLWGEWPGGYHVTNLLLHLGCVALVWAAESGLGGAPTPLWPSLGTSTQ